METGMRFASGVASTDPLVRRQGIVTQEPATPLISDSTLRDWDDAKCEGLGCPFRACGKSGHHQTNRLAYLSAFVFNVAEGKWSRHKGHAGTASACVHTRDTRHVHSGCYAREASG